MALITTKSPVAIGGLGGSGTRLFATLLELYGYHLGNNLNNAKDNFWFTLLFKRHSTILETDIVFSELAEIFFSALQGNTKPARSKVDLIFSLAEKDRMGHSREWLNQQAENLISTPETIHPFWGWKEPNTHIFIEKFLKINQHLKYIHVLRDPYYMAFSKNQNQLKNWGPILFDSDVEISPRNSLALWRKIHERITLLEKNWPNRIFIARYEDLVSQPEHFIQKICSFLEITFIPSVTSEIQQFISKRPSVEPLRSFGSQFSENDVQYINLHWQPINLAST